MVFFLSFIPDDELSLFLTWARQQLEEQTGTIQEKVLPALRGLELVASGGVLDANGMAGKNGEAPSRETLLPLSQFIPLRVERLAKPLVFAPRCFTHTSVIINNKHGSVVCGDHACAAVLCGSVN